MIRITAETEVQAPIDVCFDLARDMELHTRTVWAHTRERVIGGTCRGLIGAGETVTFEAVHFGVRQRLTSRVAAFEPPYRFVDEMTEGAFRSMRHEHEFSARGDNTIMKDTLVFEAPFGPLGWLAERLVLGWYMKKFIRYRQRELKRYAEAGALSRP